MRIMARMGAKVLEQMGDDAPFVPCLHSLGAPLERDGLRRDQPWRRLLHSRAAQSTSDPAAARHLQLASDEVDAALAYARASDQARSVFAPRRRDRPPTGGVGHGPFGALRAERSDRRPANVAGRLRGSGPQLRDGGVDVHCGPSERNRHGDRHREAAPHNNVADLLHAHGEADEAMQYLKLAVTFFAAVGVSGGHQPEIWKLLRW